MRLAAVVLLAACGRVSFDPRSSDGGSDASLDAPAANAVLQLSAGGFVTCALLGSGDVWCWGSGDEGGLGDNSGSDRIAPGKVLLAVPATQISTNDAGTCAVSADGTMRCWGWNSVGQLGVGVQGMVTTPLQVVDSDVSRVGLGNSLGCIRRLSGQLACAGNGSLVGTVNGNQLTFKDMAGVPDAIAVSGGDDFVCALRADRSVWCLGANFEGAFGNGTQVSSTVPTPGPLGPYASIAAGDRHVCALRAKLGQIGGSVECWGNGANGELGNGAFATSTLPTPVPGLDDIVQIASSSLATCALHATGLVDCWGESFQLGDASVSDRATPGPVPITDVVEISAQTGLHVCARRRDNTVWCWGMNGDGQLGSGTLGVTAQMPAQVIGLP